MGAAQEDRPAGLAEREPNDSAASAELLVFDEPRIGLLTTEEDRDYWRFSLPAGQHVRLTVTPPANVAMGGSLSWGSKWLGRAHAGQDGRISGQE